MSEKRIALRQLVEPEDEALAQLSGLLHAVFPDPDTVLGLDRLRAFLAQPRGQPGRDFCVVVAVENGLVVGGTIFSYVPATNCGFSEYLVVRKERHGQGIGRLLFDARQAALNTLAREFGLAMCSGLFIEADSPERTPPQLQARERETATDAATRLEVFAHLGFLRVDLAYVQPPLGPGKHPVRYLDLLFARWDAGVLDQAHVPAAWVIETLCPIWQSWSSTCAACEALRQRLGTSKLALVPLTR